MADRRFDSLMLRCKFEHEITTRYKWRFQNLEPLAFVDDRETNRKQYVFVCEDTHSHNNSKCVVKCMDKSDPPTNEYAMLVELSKSPHPNIVQLYADSSFHNKDDYNYMFIEKMDSSLNKYLREPKTHNDYSGADGNVLISTIMEQLLAGVAYLHSRNYAHMDLKPENILVNRYGPVIKLADFGISVSFSIDSTTNKPFFEHAAYNPINPGMYVTAMYRPIELTAIYGAEISSEKPFIIDPTAVDVWSIGVILYQIMFTLSNHIQPSFHETSPYWPFYLHSNDNKLHQHNIANYTNMLGPIAEQLIPWPEMEERMGTQHASPDAVAKNTAQVRSRLNAIFTACINSDFIGVMLQMFTYNPEKRIAIATAQKNIQTIGKQYLTKYFF